MNSHEWYAKIIYIDIWPNVSRAMRDVHVFNPLSVDAGYSYLGLSKEQNVIFECESEGHYFL